MKKNKTYYIGLLLTISNILTQGISHGQTNDPFSSKPDKTGAEVKSASPAPRAKTMTARVEPEDYEYLISESLPRNIEICYEEFSLPLDKASEIRRERLTDVELYNKILGLTRDGEAAQETMTIQYSKTGMLTKTKAITEIISPIETQKPSEPSSTQEGKNKTTTAQFAQKLPEFRFKELGRTLEVEVTVEPPLLLPLTDKGDEFLHAYNSVPDIFADPFVADPLKNEVINTPRKALMDGHIEKFSLINMRLNISNVTQEGSSKWMNSDSTVSEFPNFQVKEVSAIVTLISGTTSFLGTTTMPTNLNPEVEMPKRVWFAFVTATVKIPRN